MSHWTIAVPVPVCPGRHGVSLDRVHFDVHGKEVVAAFGAVSKDIFKEGPRAAALALQPAEGIGDGYDDGVDFTCGDLLLQLLDCQL
jgi:hypothetical protein